MSLPRRSSYLWRQSKNSSYYFRCLIPKDLLPVLDDGNYRYVERKLDEDIEKFELEVTKGSKTYRVLYSNYKNLLLQSINFRKDVRTGKVKNEYDFVGDGFHSNLDETTVQKEPREPELSREAEPNESGEKIRDLIESYLDEVRKSENMTPKTQSSVKKTIELFIEVIGNIHVSQLKSSHGRKYKEILMKLPPNRNKMKWFRDKSIPEVIRINKKKDGKTLSANTINNNLSYISTYFNWMKRNGYIEQNPLEGTKLKKSKSKQEERERFTVEELQTIFSPDNYLKEIKRRGKNSKVIVPCYWIPIILVFTGCRLNEVSQLHIEDIKKVKKKNIWYFDINDDTEDKGLKNKSSRRVVTRPPDPDRIGIPRLFEEVEEKKGKKGVPRIEETTGRVLQGNQSVVQFRLSPEIEDKSPSEEGNPQSQIYLHRYIETEQGNDRDSRGAVRTFDQWRESIEVWEEVQSGGFVQGSGQETQISGYRLGEVEIEEEVMIPVDWHRVVGFVYGKRCLDSGFEIWSLPDLKFDIVQRTTENLWLVLTILDIQRDSCKNELL